MIGNDFEYLSFVKMKAWVF